MTGEVISHFEILEVLGEGGMGIVYLARDTRLDRTVAVKLLPERVMDAADRERFSLEARSAGTLSHPNICTVFEYDEVDGQALIAMEYIEGPSLKSKTDQHTLTADEAAVIAKQIASGLAAAHAKGVIHRDIKPANVLLTEEGVAKVCDFGLAKLVGGGALTQTGISLGTIAYMSPEQVRGEAVGPATDVWSLGAVLFEMLTGRLPFPHNYPSAIMYAIVHEEPQDLDLVEKEHGTEMADLVRVCLAKDPSDRPSASEVVDILGGDATTASLRLSQPVRKPAGDWKRIGFGAAGLVAILIAAILLFRPAPDATPDFTGASIAILPLAGVDGATADADSALLVTLNGFLQTVSGAIDGAMRARGSGSVVPFSDVVEMMAATPEDASGKIGADYAVTSKLVGYDPVPTLSFSLVHDGDPIGASVSVPILISSLQESYEAAVTQVGNLLGIPDSTLVRPVTESRAVDPEAFRSYTRAMGLLQDRSSLRSLTAAEDLLDRAIATDPDFAPGYAALGKVKLYRFEATKELGLLDQAERYSDEAIRLDPELMEAYVTLGATFVHTGKPGQAQRALQTALSREPFNTGALLALAEVQETLDEHELAEQTFKRAVASNPGYWGVYNRLGRYYVARSQWALAAEQYQRVVDLAPSNSIGYRNLGAMYWYLGRIEDARQSWELSLEIEPSYSTYNNLGTMHFYEGNYSDAASAYEKALEINDQDHRVWGHLSAAYYWMKADRGKYLRAKRKAAEMAEEWLRVNPTDRTVKAELAGYYGELGETGKSRMLLDQFGEEPDEDITSQTSFQIGAAWEVVGNRTAALAWIEDALAKGYAVNEVTDYPGLDALRADPAFVRIMRSLVTDSVPVQ